MALEGGALPAPMSRGGVQSKREGGGPACAVVEGGSGRRETLVVVQSKREE